MLIRFTVGNYRSFKEPVTLWMEKEKRVKEEDLGQVIKTAKGREFLTSAAIYGANASGKSNLVKAAAFMQTMIRNSAKESLAGEPIEVEPFLLDAESQNEPSYFEISLLIDDAEYIYGFEATRERVTEEWLYFYPEKRRTLLFHREGQKIRLNRTRFKEGLRLEERTRPNALFLSVVAQWNGETALKMIETLKKINFLSGSEPEEYRQITENLLQSGHYTKEIIRFLCSLDLAIADIQIKKRKNVTDIPDFLIFQQTIVNTFHQGSDGKRYIFNLDTQESKGTQKLFALSGPLIDTLKSGTILFIDELESQLHPLLTTELIKLFRTDAANTHGAQLIFTTHDANLIGRRKNMLREDQIWFTEKRRDESSDLFSLSEFGTTKEKGLNLDYLRGKYGAVPFTSDLADVFKEAGKE